jgi:gamma-glutamylcyclotransferase (GGCT)/AIG2-like uncharacterized protein YtfP
VVETDSFLLMFFYGTLKRGQSNHDRFCRGAVHIEAATTLGRLYELPFGFPGLHVNRDHVQAIGTRDYLADAGKQREAPTPLALAPGWDIVYGELFIFEDPERRLVALDALEGYAPGEDGLYRRVLIPVQQSRSEMILAWAYELTSPAGTYLPSGRWPA